MHKNNVFYGNKCEHSPTVLYVYFDKKRLLDKEKSKEAREYFINKAYTLAKNLRSRLRRRRATKQSLYRTARFAAPATKPATNISTIRPGTERSRAANVRTPIFYRNFPPSSSYFQMENCKSSVTKSYASKNAVSQMIPQWRISCRKHQLTLIMIQHLMRVKRTMRASSIQAPPTVSTLTDHNIQSR